MVLFSSNDGNFLNKLSSSSSWKDGGKIGRKLGGKIGRKLWFSKYIFYNNKIFFLHLEFLSLLLWRKKRRKTERKTFFWNIYFYLYKIFYHYFIFRFSVVFSAFSFSTSSKKIKEDNNNNNNNIFKTIILKDII